MIHVRYTWIAVVLALSSVEISAQIAFRFERTSSFNKRVISASNNLGLLNFNLTGITPYVAAENTLSVLPPIALDNVASGDPVRVVERPLNYPNPFRRQDDTTLYYRLSRHMDVEIKIYNMLGQQLSSTQLMAGSEGAWEGVNRVKLSRLGIPLYDLPAGVYFYLIMSGGQVLGRGKMAAI